MGKKIRDTKCAVNGCFKFGKISGICGKFSLHGEFCMAHGSKKCEHKIPVKIVEEEKSRNCMTWRKLQRNLEKQGVK